MTSVNEDPCKEFVTPGLTSSSNRENYIKLSFSKRLIGQETLAVAIVFSVVPDHLFNKRTDF